jgi:flagellar biogenesis protein FliO
MFLLSMEVTSDPITTVDLGAAFLKMFLTLSALIGLLVLTAWFFKKIAQQRLEKTNQNSLLTVLEKRAISPKTMLYVVEMDNKKILFTESQLEVKRLETFEDSSINS